MCKVVDFSFFPAESLGQSDQFCSLDGDTYDLVPSPFS